MSLRTVELDELRRRRSEKWRKFPGDVLPSHIAEMDFAVAPGVNLLNVKPGDQVEFTLVPKPGAQGEYTVTDVKPKG